ncbi:unnamed protein product [Prunus brigantina]
MSRKGDDALGNSLVTFTNENDNKLQINILTWHDKNYHGFSTLGERESSCSLKVVVVFCWVEGVLFIVAGNGSSPRNLNVLPNPTKSGIFGSSRLQRLQRRASIFTHLLSLLSSSFHGQI